MGGRASEGSEAEVMGGGAASEGRTGVDVCLEKTGALCGGSVPWAQGLRISEAMTSSLPRRLRSGLGVGVSGVCFALGV